MKYAIFPQSGRKLSKLGFGAMGFAGWFGDQPKQTHIASLLAALEQGVNVVDTARAYGDSEEILGEALRQWSGEPPFLATKIQGLGPNSQWGWPTDVAIAFPPGHIRADCVRCLRALGVEQVDLMQLHIYWPTWGVSGYWMDELQALKAEGKARFVGISVPDHRSDMVLPLVQSGLIDSVQTVINIFDPLALEALVPICQQHDVAVIARCILDEGGLTGFLTQDVVFDKGDFRYGYFDEIIPRSVYMDKVDALRQYVPQYASSLAALAIKFAIHHPGVTSALTSMHVRAYADMNIAAVDEAPLPDDIFHKLFTRHRFIKNLSYLKHWEEER
jgi:aryl-alcohol dehydrogenase-like predicted oxidoreductase